MIREIICIVFETAVEILVPLFAMLAATAAICIAVTLFA